MRIKYIVLLLTFSIVFCESISAQKGTMEARFDLGYGFQSGIQTFGDNITTTNETAVNASLGAGYNISAAATYWFSDNIGGSLDVGYLVGLPVTIAQDHPYSIFDRMGHLISSGTFNEKVIFSGSMFSVMPNIVFSAHLNKINPYSRLGLVIGGPSVTQTTTYSGNYVPNTGSDVVLGNGGAAIGLYAALGIQYPISKKMMINLEVFDRDLSYAPTMAKNTHSFDGVSTRPTVDYTASQNVSASTQLESYYPFSSVGLKIGVSIKIGG